MKFHFFLLCSTSLILLLVSTTAFGGRGGGSRGGGSRGSGSGSRGRGSSGGTRGSTYPRNSDGDGSKSQPKPPPPPKVSNPEPYPKQKKPPPPSNVQPSAPVAPVPNVNPNVHNPPYNPSYPGPQSNIPGSNTNRQLPPPYPGTNQGPPPSYPGVNQGPPPPYPGTNQGRPPAYNPAEPPPSYPGIGRQPPYGSQGQNSPYPQQPGTGNVPYPRQPGMGSAPYPQQPGMGSAPYPQQPGMGNRPYPQQPGMSGGMQQGGNVYVTPHKKQGVLGSLFSMGKSKQKTPKQPFGVPGGSYSHGYSSKSGMSKAMYPIIPIMAARQSSKMFNHRPSSFGFLPAFALMSLYSPYYSHHHHHGYYRDWESSPYYDIDNDRYRGLCRKPLAPGNADLQCARGKNGVKCLSKCLEGYKFPDNTTYKENECWHIGGVWKPQKNFESCKPVCNITCENGGTCFGPNECTCKPEYRGRRCEYNFQKCDVLKLVRSNKQIGWVCTHSRNETTCTLRCKEPAHFVTPPPEIYRCLPEGEWSPDSVPECITDDIKE